jgi:hypothetical protein
MMKILMAFFDSFLENFDTKILQIKEFLNLQLGMNILI